jgi:hypothetical protein
MLVGACRLCGGNHQSGMCIIRADYSGQGTWMPSTCGSAGAHLDWMLPVDWQPQPTPKRSKPTPAENAMMMEWLRELDDENE